MNSYFRLPELKFIVCSMFLSLLLIPVSIAAEDKMKKDPGDPVASLKQKDEQLKTILKNRKNDDDAVEKIKSLIHDMFDFGEMGKKALGTKTFKGMDEILKERFVKAFTSMVVNASVKKLEVYETDSVAYDEPKLKRGKAQVTVHTFTGGTESILEYKLLPVNGEWKAWDLIIDDLSTYRNYKEQFKQILETKTLVELVEILEEKADKEAESKEKEMETPKKPSSKGEAG